MYEKQLIGRRPLYFRYAPPLTGLDDYSDDDLPKAPFPKAPPYQRSVYYYWWLFLKEHEGYRACCESQDGPIHVYPSPAFKMDDDNRVVVSIPVDRDVDGMLAELKQLLKPLRKQVPVKRTEGAKYPVLAKPVLSSLHQHYEVWRLRKQYPDKPLHEIGDLAGITVDDKSD